MEKKKEPKSFKCESARCEKCNESFPELEGEILSEEAILVCPTCGTKLALSATVKEPGEGGATPEGEKVKASGEGAEVPSGEPRIAGAAETTPEGAAESLESGKAKVLCCSYCENKWVSLKESKTCPICNSDGVKVSDQPIYEAVKEVRRKVEFGYPVSESVRMFLGEKDDYSARWVGSLSDFNTKLQALRDEAGIPGDLGDVVSALEKGGALEVKGEEIHLNTQKARKALIKMKAPEVKEMPGELYSGPKDDDMVLKAMTSHF